MTEKSSPEKGCPYYGAARPVPASASDPINHTEALLLLGQICLNKGEQRQAFEIFEIAARSRSAFALNMLGRAYEREWGTPRNTALAAGFFTEAAEAGDAWAMFNLADLYMTGEGVGRDLAVAWNWYARAAQKGIVKALTMLGLIAEEGVISSVDQEAAQDFFLAAATGGDCWGCLNLARIYLDKMDTEQALIWLLRAIDTGFSDVFRSVIALLAGEKDPRLAGIAGYAEQRLRDHC
ncbi:tetratricopeptide repeat protein [Acetobacter oeni]|uniref:Sel1 repeat family protein n=1 Tax=Acetobacter oeni TaxID=304077 RepID=A0A511XJR3_9PROT|nr:tetratricopeptide repeat protein [Acetobacter oeni]MBB3883414.1 TPR repeat protein [Acetobacter oeni]NHO19387.1 sel1 repeat family protein [Acetobacter oeni]GBR03966.1 hypothetical protein AA21952_1245 [Acetobacter oeni LMG 21952]GEN63195.1 hypothetical protein AOE01nite_14190 [Acetobacter oeni]